MVVVKEFKAEARTISMADSIMKLYRWSYTSDYDLLNLLNELEKSYTMLKTCFFFVRKHQYFAIFPRRFL